MIRTNALGWIISQVYLQMSPSLLPQGIIKCRLLLLSVQLHVSPPIAWSQPHPLGLRYLRLLLEFSRLLSLLRFRLLVSCFQPPPAIRNLQYRCNHWWSFISLLIKHGLCRLRWRNIALFPRACPQIRVYCSGQRLLRHRLSSHFILQRKRIVTSMSWTVSLSHV
jgi:hypothetical protein